MRVPHHLGRILVMLALAFGVNAQYGSAFASRVDLRHVPRGNHRNFPSHRMHRFSGRVRRSQGWEAPETPGTGEAHLRPSAISAQGLRASGGSSHEYAVLPASLPTWERCLGMRHLSAVTVLARCSAPRAPGSPRGPPIS